jgi:hypothetical protein
MKIKILFLSLLLLTTGCTTVEFVRKETSPLRQATLRYYPPSSDERAAKYRAELSKQATDFCEGDFIITKEYMAREDDGNTAGVGTGIGMGAGSIFLSGSNRSSTMYNFVEISCH